MTSLLVDDYHELPDCPYRWGEGYDPCSWHDLPVHRCLIQGGHDNLCLCMCGAEAPPTYPRPQRLRWAGDLNDSPARVARLLRARAFGRL